MACTLFREYACSIFTGGVHIFIEISVCRYSVELSAGIRTKTRGEHAVDETREGRHAAVGERAEVDGNTAEAFIYIYARLLLCALFIALNRKHSSLGPENFAEFNETFQAPSWRKDSVRGRVTVYYVASYIWRERKKE